MLPFIFLLIIALIFSFSPSVPPSTQKAEISQSVEVPFEEKEEIPESIIQTTPISEPAIKLVTTKPSILMDTYIVSGPKEGEVIEETTKVTFGFDAKVFPKEIENQLAFETKIEQLNEDWILTIKRERTIILPSGPKAYTFLVRAKIQNSVDITPARRTFIINASPHFGKVKISNVEIENRYYPSLVTLSTQLGQGEKISITGWSIKGKKGAFTIPQGIEKYYPGYYSIPSENIIIQQNDTIYLSGSSSPLGRNGNFRPNKCMGYLANYQEFPIPLSLICPRPTGEEISHLDPCCKDFILRMGTCAIPDYSNNYRVSQDLECTSYLNNYFNYASCFYQHSRDENFLENSWHIYLNSNFLVTNDCDTLYLRDQNGFFVDKFSYGYPICW